MCLYIERFVDSASMHIYWHAWHISNWCNLQNNFIIQNCCWSKFLRVTDKTGATHLAIHTEGREELSEMAGLVVVVIATGEVEATRMLIIGALLERLRGLSVGMEELAFRYGWLPLEGGGSTSMFGCLCCTMCGNTGNVIKQNFMKFYVGTDYSTSRQ